MVTPMNAGDLLRLAVTAVERDQCGDVLAALGSVDWEYRPPSDVMATAVDRCRKLWRSMHPDDRTMWDASKLSVSDAVKFLKGA